MSPDTINATATPSPVTALRPAPGRQEPLPEYVRTTDRNALPAVLDWANEAECPPVLCSVDVIRFGIALGTGTVVGYFHHAGELGCWVDLDIPLDGSTRVHLYGDSLRRLDEGEENAAPAPAATATVSDEASAPRVELPLVFPEPVAVPVGAGSATAREQISLLDSDTDYMGDDDKLEL